MKTLKQIQEEIQFGEDVRIISEERGWLGTHYIANPKLHNIIRNILFKTRTERPLDIITIQYGDEDVHIIFAPDLIAVSESTRFGNKTIRRIS